MRRDAERFRRSLKVVAEYKEKPDVYHVQPDDYESNARYIDTEYLHYMASVPDCHIMALHYDTIEAAAKRSTSLAWSIHANIYPIHIATRGNCVYLIKGDTDG